MDRYMGMGQRMERPWQVAKVCLVRDQFVLRSCQSRQETS